MNVYSRAESRDSKLPVIVWIHGGGFAIGSGSDFLYGPKRAMNEPLVLATVNYRLGALGFATIEEDKSCSNLGLLDQRLAIQWIKDNAAAFGGNPENVTLAGESAGAASIHYHMMSAGSQGLFHKVILQSGTATCPWAIADPKLANDSLSKLEDRLKKDSGDSLKTADVDP